MTDNQIEPHNPGAPVAAEGPTENVPPDTWVEAKVSDTEASHAPQEGRAFSGDAEQGASGGQGRERREDYGGGTMGHSRPGSDISAGAAFADRMPEASSTPAEEGDQPGTKTSPSS
jgi:hypothetical protein